jgi:lipoate-protein ligase B
MDLGRMEYMRAWELQRSLARARAESSIPDVLLFVEHPPTYTLGKRTRPEHLLVDRLTLENEGFAVHMVDRGGDITYHGPGQLVGYPIVSLEGRPGGPSRYLRDLEEVIILGLEAFGIRAGRMEGFTGVWVGGAKIAAIGVRINARRVTTHGFALNVCPDLEAFGRIIPCGIRGKAVTSMREILGIEPSWTIVQDRIAQAFESVFDVRMRLPDDLDKDGSLVSMTIEHARTNARLDEFSCREVVGRSKTEGHTRSSS